MNRIIEKQFGRVLIQPATLDRENRTVDVVFATETPVPRFGWEEDYNEVLQCDPSAVRMERINKGLPVVDSHRTASVFSQLGKSVKVWFDKAKREMWATIKFSTRSEVEGIFKDIEDGIISEISVGYRVYKFEREAPTEGNNPVYRAVDWMPVELSFCSVPADINSGTRNAVEKNEVLIFNNNNNMEEQGKNTTTATPTEGGATRTHEGTPQPQPQPAPDIEQVRADATKAERRRLEEILTSVRAANLPDTYAIELHISAKSLDACRQAILEKVIAAQTPPPAGAHTAGVGKEAIEAKRAGVEDAILHRINPEIFKLDDNARQYRGMSLIEIGKDLLTEHGVNVRGLDKTAVSEMLFGHRAHTTSDFPLLLENVANKMLLGDYQFDAEFWPLIARQTTVSDFREKGFYRVESANGMKEVAEGGEIKYTTLSEGKESIRIKSFGEGIKFTRQALINDDLSAFSLIPQRFIKDWDELRGQMVWDLIVKNVKLSDGKALYSTDHNNLITGANSALSEEGLAAAMVKFKRQTGLDGKRPIRVIPKYLIVPPELEVTAKKLVTAITASNTKDVNVFTNAFSIIVEQRLTSATEWYLMAAPAALPCFYYAYLDGSEALRVKTTEDFDTDSVKYAVRGEFGVAAVDFRGTVKSAGK